MSKGIKSRQSKSLYIEIIIAIVFLSIVAAVVMLVYSRTNHLLYINNLKDTASGYSRSYTECLKSGMDREKALVLVFGEDAKWTYSLDDDTQAVIEVEQEDVECTITLKYTKGDNGTYTDIDMEYKSYFGELYSFSGGVYKSINEEKGEDTV